MPLIFEFTILFTLADDIDVDSDSSTKSQNRAKMRKKPFLKSSLFRRQNPSKENLDSDSQQSTFSFDPSVRIWRNARRSPSRDGESPSFSPEMSAAHRESVNLIELDEMKSDNDIPILISPMHEKVISQIAHRQSIILISDINGDVEFPSGFMENESGFPAVRESYYRRKEKMRACMVVAEEEVVQNGSDHQGSTKVAGVNS